MKTPLSFVLLAVSGLNRISKNTKRKYDIEAHVDSEGLAECSLGAQAVVRLR